MYDYYIFKKKQVTSNSVWFFFPPLKQTEVNKIKVKQIELGGGGGSEERLMSFI